MHPHVKRFICCPQCQDHSKGSYDQNMTVSTISSELLILKKKKLGLKINHHKPECLVKKNDYCIQGQSTAKGQNVSAYPDDIF